jgi:hypothetical protein
MASALNHRYPTVQGEFEDEFEDEGELEAEDEFEGEDFLGDLGRIGRGVGGLLGEGEEEAEFEAEHEFDFEAEAEAEDEGEEFVNPARRIYPDAELMAHLSGRAAEAESELEAEAFLGALVPIAARLIPRAASLVTRTAPALIRGVIQVNRALRRDPQGRRLMRALPVVLQRTAQSLADQAAAGRPVTGATALQTLGRMTTRVLASPDACRSAVRAVGVFERRYQRRMRREAARPGGSIAGAPAYGPPARRAVRGRRSTGTARRARRSR